MPKCFKCKKPIISFNNMQTVYVTGSGKTTWCLSCYDEEVSKFNLGMTETGKNYTIRQDVMDEELKDKRW